MPKITTFGAVVAATLLIIGLIAGAFIGPMIVPREEVPVGTYPMLTGEIPIGYLADDDYVYLQLGQKWAIEMAEEDINNYYKKLGIPATVKFYTENAEGSSVKALEKAQSLAAMGCKVIIGWGWTSMINAAKSFCDANHILIVSGGSTGMTMAIPDDFIYRLRGSDIALSRVSSRMMAESGTKAIAALHVGEAWGDSFWPLVKKDIEKLGMVVVNDLRFSVDAVEFSSEMSQTAEAVREATAKYGKDKVAVYILAWYKHHTPMMKTAEAYSELSEVLWFSSGGLVFGTDVIESAGEIAAKTVNPSPNEACSKTPKYIEFCDRFRAMTGVDPPGISAANMYDCAWAVALTILQVGKYDADAIKEMFPEVCENFYGIVGWMRLNEAGDRAYQDYEIDAIVKDPDGTIHWKQIAYYDMANDNLQWFTKPGELKE